jgi:hypothetical protein
MTENNNRWWEFYVARYLAGNMFAVLVLFYLVAFYGSDIQHSLCQLRGYIPLCKDNFTDKVFGFIFQTTREIEPINSDIAVIDSSFILNKNTKIIITEINFANIFILGVFGFLYMYISSIPTYFFHVMRGFFGNIIRWICRMIFSSDNISKISFSNSEFLKKSTLKRDEIKKERYDREFSPEYITSYQHVRENGNAFGIIITEIIFAWLLIISNFSLYLIVIWLSFGFFGWFLGIYFEFKMVDSADK